MTSINELTVVVFGSSEYGRRRTGNVPLGVNTEKVEKPNKSMTHQSDTSTLGRGAEEADLDLLLAQNLCVMKDGIESRLADRRAIIFNAIDDTNTTSCVWLDFIPKHAISVLITEIRRGGVVRD